MNREEAVRSITEYWALVEKASELPFLSQDRRVVMRDVNKRLPAVNQVLSSLAPDTRAIKASSVREHLGARPRVSRALEIIASWGKMESAQHAADEPVLPISQLDPVIGGVALPLWNVGKYRQAVNDAATNLNQFAQSRLGRYDISDRELMAQAFSDKDPEKGKARLRCPAVRGSETITSLQDGAKLISMGAFQAIRNPAHHLSGDWSPVTAFHYLAVLSQVAYWFRNWDVAKYVPPAPNLNVTSIALSDYMQSQARARQAQNSEADQ
jgi:hypothetical protein